MEAHYKIQSKLVLRAHDVWDLNVKILQSKILKLKKERNAPRPDRVSERSTTRSN